MNSNSMWTAEQILRERARREKCIGVHRVKNANILTFQQTNKANMNEMSNSDSNKHLKEDINSWLYDIYPDHCRHATIVPLMMRGGGNVDSVPSKRAEKGNNSINMSNNNNNCSSDISGSANSNKKSKHSESSSKKMNGNSENLNSANPTVELASALVSRKNSRLSFFTKGSSKHSNKSNSNVNYSEVDTTKHAQSGSMTGKSTVTPLTASTPFSTSSQSLTKTPLSLPSAKGKTKEGNNNNNNNKLTSIDTTSAGTINGNIGNNSSTITDPHESESASAMEQLIASRPTLTIITDLDDDMEYDGDVEGERNMYHTIIKSNMTSAHDNEYTHSTIATPTHVNTAAGAAGIYPSPHDNVRFTSKTNSLLDLSRMSSTTYHHHSRYPSSNNMANSAYPITSAHDTTQPTCKSDINEQQNNYNNNNIMSSSPSSALPNLPCLPPIDESDPLHLNNLATSSFNPNNNNNNNNNNLNTILFHGVNTASSHSNSHNASMHEYPARSAHSTRYELPNVLDVNYMNSSHSFNTNNNNNNNNNTEGKYSTRLLEPTGSAHNNNNNNTTALEEDNNNNNRCMSRCPTMESIPEMRSSCHRLTATPIVPINAFVDHEARRRTALEMQRRFGGNNYGASNNSSNNTSTGIKVEETATNDTSNVAIKDLNNNNNNNENKAQSVNSAKSTVSDNVIRPSIIEVNNQGNLNNSNNNNSISASKAESVVVVNNNNIGENRESNKYESTSSLIHSTNPSMVLLSNTEIKESSRSNNKIAQSAHTNTTNNSIELNKKKDKVEKSAKFTEKKSDTLSKESVCKSYKSHITLNLCPRNSAKSKDYKLHPSVVNAAAVRAEAQRQAREKIIRIGAQRLQERLNELHLVTYRIKHDGNCQFRAIAQQLLGSEDYNDMIRSHVLSYMKRVRAKCFDYYFESPKAADAYFDKLSKPGSWGDELTLRAASDSLYINIHVLSSQEKNCYILYRPSEDAPPPPTFLVDVAKIRQRRRAERAWRKQQQQQQQEMQNKNNNNALCSTSGVLLKPENMQPSSSLINSVNTSQANSMDFNGYSNANSLLNSFVNNSAYWHDPMSYGTTTNNNNNSNNISSRLLLQRQETSPLLAHNLQTTNMFKSHFDKSKESKVDRTNDGDGEDEVNDWNDPDAEIDACEVQRALQAKLLHRSIIVPRQFAQQGSLSLAPTAPVTRIHTPVASFSEQEYHPMMHNNINNNNVNNNAYVAPYTYTDLLAPHGNMPPSHNLLRPLKDQVKLNAEPQGVATEPLSQLQVPSIPHASSVQSMPQLTNPSQLWESNDSNRVHDNVQCEQTTFGIINNTRSNNDLLNDEPHAFVASPITRNETEPFPTMEKTSTVTLDRTRENTSISNNKDNDNNAMHDGIAVTVPRVHNAQNALEQANNNNISCCRAMTHVGSTNSLCSTLSRFTAAGAEVQCNPTLTINLVRHTEISQNKLNKMRNSGLQINTSIATTPQQAHWATSSASSSLGVTPFINTLNNNNHHNNYNNNNNAVVMNAENIDSNNSFPVFQNMPNNDVMLLASSSLAANLMPVSSSITQQQQQQQQLLLLPSTQGQQSNSHLATTTTTTNNNNTSFAANEDKTHLEHEENKLENVAGIDNMDHVCCHTIPEDTTVFNITPNPSSLDESPYNQTPLSSTAADNNNNMSAEYQPVETSALDEEHESNLSGDVCFVFEPRTEPIDVFISYLYPVHYNALIVVESSEAAAALAANESKLPELLNDVGVNNNNKSPLVAKSPMIGKSPLLQDSSCSNSCRSAFASQNKTITSSACAPERKEVNGFNGVAGNNTTTAAVASATSGKRVNMDTEHTNTFNFITPCSTHSGLTTSSMSTLQQPPPPPAAPAAQPNQVIGASFLRLKNKSFVSLPNSFSQY